ncbi:hypothetical protein Bpfe_013947 [Biomphalaria pfeifferi]|uniref:Uncharacterized protein n=1 Tax=Biomphalaria pfeifferi TaxID=112525 RepID=A0AAD8BL99_BIOPF|nr:hypothetical protein Bpfe_013947 [Biomphalaria pfeifferi]
MSGGGKQQKGVGAALGSFRGWGRGLMMLTHIVWVDNNFIRFAMKLYVIAEEDYGKEHCTEEDYGKEHCTEEDYGKEHCTEEDYGKEHCTEEDYGKEHCTEEDYGK